MTKRIVLFMLLGVLVGCKSTAPSSGADSASSPSVPTVIDDGGGAATRNVPLPGGASGIGFDDLLFAPGLRQIIAPGGATGTLDLIDPSSLVVTAIGGFSSSQGQYKGGHGEGMTSADEGRGLLFAIDRTAMRLDVVDPDAKAIVASAALGASPDYVRWVETTNEIWVSEPDAEQIEVFSVLAGNKPTPLHSVNIPVKGGPESLVIDPTRKRAFTHLWNGASVAIDVTTRSILSTWGNDCTASRGIAIDARRGFLFAGCSEGKAVVLDVDHDGKQLGSVSAGSGVDVISYSTSLGHLYLPGSSSATMAILAVSPTGSLVLLGTVPTANGAHCVAADDRGQAWVCDPNHGQLLVFKDNYPPVTP